MPDLPDRARYEAELTQQLSRALASAKNELTDILWREGLTQGDLANVPADVFERLRVELQRILQIALVDVFVDAANNFASTMSYAINQDELQSQAQNWATEYAASLARDLLNTRTSNLQRIAAGAPDLPLQKKDLIALLLSALAVGGAATIAVTEISNAISQGEQRTRETLERDGSTVESIWYTQEDERVCPECGPRHGNTEGNGWALPPPLHPNCRCYLGYRVTDASGNVTILFDDDEVAKLLS